MATDQQHDPHTARSAVAEPPHASGHLVEFDEYIESQLRKTQGHVRGVDAATAAMVLAAFTLAYVMVAALFDHWIVNGGLGFWSRALFLGLYVLLAAGYLIVRVVPLVVRQINPLYAAQTIERGAPSLKNTLLNFLFLRGAQGQLSPAMLQAVERQAATNLAGAHADAAVDRSKLIKVGYVLLATLLVCAVYALASPKDLFQTVGRIAAPWADINAPTQTTVSEVEPRDTLAFRGQQIAVSARINNLPEAAKAVLFYTTADGQVVDRPIEMKLGPDGYKHTCMLPADEATLQQDVEYRIEAGDAITRGYHVEVIAAPTIFVEAVEYKYPAYTGLLAQRVERQGDLRGIEGTSVTLDALANGDIETAHVDFDCDGTLDQRMTVEGPRAKATFRLALGSDRKSPWHSSYQLIFKNQRGQQNPQPVRQQIDVMRDIPPEIEFVSPKSDEIDVPANGTATLEIVATDPDFALNLVKLSASKGRAPLFDKLLLDEAHRGQFVGKHRFEPAKLGLKAGDVVEYSALAEDNKDAPANRTLTATRRIRIIGPQAAGDRQNQDDNRQGGAGQDQDNRRGDGAGDRRDDMPPDEKGRGQARGEPDEPDSDQGEEAQGGREGTPQSRQPDRADEPDGAQPNETQPDSADQQRSEEQSSSDPSKSDKQESGAGQQEKGEQKQGDRKQSGQQQGAGEQGKSEQGEGNDGAGQQGAGQQGAGQQGAGQQGAGQQGAGQQGAVQQGAVQQGAGQQSRGQAGKNAQGSDKQQTQSGEGQQAGGKQPEQDERSAREGQQGQSRQNGNASSEGAKQQPSGQGGQQHSPRDEPSQNVASDGSNDGDAIERILNHREQQEQQNGTQGGKSTRNSAEPERGDTRDGRQSAAEPQRRQQGDGEKADASKRGADEGAADKGQEKPDPRRSKPGESEREQSKAGERNDGQSDQARPNETERQEQGSKEGPQPDGQQQRPSEGRQGQAGQQQDKPQQGRPQDGQAAQGQSDKGRPQDGEQGQRGQRPNPGEKQSAKPQDGQQDSSKPDAQEGSDASNAAKQQPKEEGQGQGQSKEGQGAQSKSDPLGNKSPGGRQQQKPDAQGGDGEQQKGTSGAGQKSEENKGSPSPQETTQPRDKSKQPSSNDSESPKDSNQAQSPSNSKRESDSEGNDEGDRSGGGKRGGGQKANQSGTGGAGQNTAADEGAGASEEAGQGETSDRAGQDQAADKPTGQSGSQKGAGSTSTSGGEQSQQAGESDGEKSQDSEGKPPEAAADSQSDGPSNAGGGTPRGGQPGQASDQQPAEQPYRTAPEVADKANLDYARKATDLALAHLKDELAKDKVDPQLLNKLGWSRDELEQFVKRWEQMRANADSPGDQGQTARRELDETLRSLGLRPRATNLRSNDARNDQTRGMRESRHTTAPADYAEQTKAYTQGTARGGK